MTAFWRIAISLGLAFFLLWRNLPGALLFLFPRLMRVRREEESWPRVDARLFDLMERELEPLGFRRLGVHAEQAPLRRQGVVYDFVCEAERTWASASWFYSAAQLELFTGFEGGGVVITADHRRPAIVDEGRTMVGGLPGASPEQVLLAHRRRVATMVAAGRAPLTDLSLDARVRAQEEWVRGPGRRELRARHINALIFSLMAVLLVGAVAVATVRSLW